MRLILLAVFTGIAVAKSHRKANKRGVTGVIGYSAEIPCEATPSTVGDSPYLILWYKDIFGTPIYSYDMREGDGGRHWMERKTLGDRASFHIRKTGRKNAEGVEMLRAYLRIENLQESDAGPYRCRVDFKQAPTRNVKVKLQLIELPAKPTLHVEVVGSEASSDGHSQPVRLNSTLEFRCVSQGGTPQPKHTWWIKRKGDASKTPLQAEQTKISNVKQHATVSSSVRLPALSRADGGAVIGCSADNSDGLVPNPPEATFTINMLLPPIVARLVREWSYFVAGETYSVRCRVEGSYPSAYVKAAVGGREVPTENLGQEEDDNAVVYTLKFVPKKEDHGQLLSCRAENPHLKTNNAVEDQWRIEVQYVPLAELSLREYRATSVEAAEGETVEMTCLVQANPKIHSVTWKRNGVSLLGSSDTKTDLSSGTSSLRLPDLDRSDAGNYSCLAENLVGSARSNALRLAVKYRPVCRRSGSHLWYSDPWETVDLPCAVDAHPTAGLAFSWVLRKKGQVVVDSAINSSDPRVEQISESGDTSTLGWRPGHSGYGRIVCTSRNEVGWQSEPCVFVVKPRGLPRIEECLIGEIGPDWIKVECEVDGVEGSHNAGGKQDDQPGKMQMAPKLKVEAFPQSASTADVPAHIVEEVVNSVSGNGLTAITLTGLEAGQRYRLRILPVSASGVEGAALPDVFSPPLPSDERGNLLTVVTVEATTKFPASNATTTIAVGNTKDPIKLLPVIGALTLVVTVLVLVAVIIVAVMRGRAFEDAAGRKHKERSHLKTHVGFNRSVDVDIDKKGRKREDDSQIDKDILKNLETISKMDSYEKLNDVRFEGFSAEERRQQRFHQASEHTSLLDTPVAGVSGEVPVASLLCVDSEQERQEEEALLSESSDEIVDHFAFREAIPAPTAVSRISQITADIAESAEALRIAAEHAAVLQTGRATSSVGPLILPPSPSSAVSMTGSLGRAQQVQQRDSWTSTSPRVTFKLKEGEERKSALKQPRTRPKDDNTEYLL